MTGPANSQTRRDGSRTYTWGGETFTSVTTILRSVPKPALVYWSARQTALKAVELTRTGALPKAIAAGESDEMVNVLRGACWEHRDDAADTGTAVHKAIERAILHTDQEGFTPQMADAARPRFEAFRAFEARYWPAWEASEATVYNRTHGYAGTFDALATIGGRRFLIDIKTGKDIYPETALQLAAYSRGEFIGLAGAGAGFGAQEHEVPRIDAAAVLLLRPRSWRFEEVAITDEVFDAFLTVMAMHGWMTDLSKRAVLGAVPHPGAADEAFTRFGGVAA